MRTPLQTMNSVGGNVILGRTYCNKFRLVQTKTV